MILTVPKSGSASARWGDFVLLPENASALRGVRYLVEVYTRETVRGIVTSPLVIHGPAGTGKTELLKTMIQEIVAAPAGHTVQSIAAGEFVRNRDDITEAKEFADLVECDLLAVEDLQLLQKKSVHSLCTLIDLRASYRRPTVVTSLIGPARMTQFPRRLTSRLSAGLVVQLQPITPAGRRLILQSAVEKKNLKLTEEALDWIAGQATGGGIRPMLGSLERLRILTRGAKSILTLEAVRKFLDDSSRPPESPVAKIVARVATAMNVKPKELLGKSRTKQVTLARQVAIYLAREVAKLTLVRIGDAFGGRDHSTVLHAIDKIRELSQSDVKLRRTLQELRAELE